MGRTKQQTRYADVEALRDRIEHWRQTRRKRSPMPSELWDAAATAARRHGVHYVARELCLNHTPLKKRAMDNQHDDKCGFVEVDLGKAVGVQGAMEAVVELVGSDGTRLTIKTVGTDVPDVLGLAREFWSRGR